MTKALEDYRDDLVVIVAGYTEPMEHFFKSNPGLKSRFNTYIEFPDYSGAELHEMLIKLCEKNAYRISEDAAIIIRQALDEQASKNSENFSNGRLVRNLYDNLVMNQAKRIFAKGSDVSDPEVLSLITTDDFDEKFLVE